MNHPGSSMRWSALFVFVLVGCGSEVQVQDEQHAPSASIQAPLDGSVTSDAVPVTFTGTVADGNGLETVQNVVWTSDLDGPLGGTLPDAQGTVTVSALLSAGVHTVTLTVTDNTGLEATDTVTITSQLEVQVPTVVIASPLDNGDYVSDTPIDLYAQVTDRQQSAETLVVVWSYEPANGGARQILASGSPTSAGVTEGTWTDLSPGAWRVILEATDQDGNIGSDQVAIIVSDPDEVDRDGDGYLGALDCDDFDAQINPGENEACNGIDDDCSFAIDDKDLDGDNHVDQNCALYVGVLARDDCNDGNGSIHPGAPELADGADNDCDGPIDEGTSLHDDDGDCYCESMALCNDSSGPTCGVLGTGDCDDTDPLLTPGDTDLDGVSSCAGDCDNTDPDLNLNDFDGDSFSTCEGDCNDFDPFQTPATCP